MKVATRTEIGLVREINEDSSLTDLNKSLFIVADGMGGHLAGEVASKIAVQTIDENIALDPINPLFDLKKAINITNEKILDIANNDTSKKGMGTTVTALLLKDDKIYLGHIGDSRAYLIREKNIEILTRDDSYVGELLRTGNLTEEEAIHHPRRNVLIRALGAEPKVEIDLKEIPLQKDDFILICTDGLHGFISDQQIETVINNSTSVDSAVDELVELVYKKGAKDNITLILLSV